MRTFGKIGRGGRRCSPRRSSRAAPLKVHVSWLDNDAHALDLFGEQDEPASRTRPADAGEPFWKQGSGKAPVVPAGVPNTLRRPRRGQLARRREHQRREDDQRATRSRSGSACPNFPFQIARAGPTPRERKQHVPSLGTGFVISPDGYIVTNNHVIEDVEKITVKFNDGRELPATVVGRDPKTDIALIKVESKEPLFALPLGDSETRAARRMGGRDRQSVRPRAHRDRGHRVRASTATSITAPTTTTSRPTPRSTPATRAARCSTSRAR